jgi:hypothetical protein
MCRFVDYLFQTLVKIVDCTCFSLRILDLSKICILLTNFVDVDFCKNIDVECRLEPEKIVYLRFARTPFTPLIPLTFKIIIFWIWEGKRGHIIKSLLKFFASHFLFF